MTKIYQGDSTNSSKRVFTWDGKYLYQGDSTNSSKRIYTVIGNLPPAILIALFA